MSGIRSTKVPSKILHLSARIDSEKIVLRKKLKIQPAQVISELKLTDVESKKIGSIAMGKERRTSERKNVDNDQKGKENQKGKKQSTGIAVTKLLDSEVGHSTNSCKGKRVFAELSEAESVLTHVDKLEPVKKVNCQKRQKIDNVKPVATTTVACVDHSSGSVNCQGSLLNGFTRASSVDSTGRFSSKDNRHSPRPATPVTGDAHGEGKEVIDHDVQMSPKRAQRYAMLRTRFADTILKANNRLMFNDEKGDSLKMQQKKELFEKKQQEDKTIEDAKLMTQQEREREAARIALEKMEKTVELYECQDIMRDFEMLIYS